MDSWANQGMITLLANAEKDPLYQQLLTNYREIDIVYNELKHVYPARMQKSSKLTLLPVRRYTTVWRRLPITVEKQRAFSRETPQIRKGLLQNDAAAP